MCLSCLEHCPIDQRVVGLIPGQGMYKKATDWCFSLTSMFLSLSLSSPAPSKSNEKMSLGDDKNNRFYGYQSQLPSHRVDAHAVNLILSGRGSRAVHLHNWTVGQEGGGCHGEDPASTPGQV